MSGLWLLLQGFAALRGPLSDWSPQALFEFNGRNAGAEDDSSDLPEMSVLIRD